ncbi:hypothetical protein PFICI_14121 [Pestalotiopsis fici W106-1]|uniref:DUF5071 domain-containing protein n=1 Tax=Pestalotiopsis fici (strain W106-1 / CGMCC3.15140) TaxID=1229662 RepID=W3WK27_PESFW|nr:uncharacterized protein PFICI_14121 [Pestalotiopsis fici W106-1]ETS74255.1 hypothetical protein PFICI_14121 [Pestalotiopsis fici W106-1]
MPSALFDKTIPRDLNDISPIASLEALDTETFATLVTEVIPRLSRRGGVGAAESKTPFYTKFLDIVQRRANEPAVVSAIAAIITQPVNSEDDLHRVLGALHLVVCELPEDQILPYRETLVAVSDPDAEGRGDRLFTGWVSPQAKDLLRFVDRRDEAWVSEHKADYMGTRSLRERVRTAREMRPFVHDLLSWLQDGNWPPYKPCEEQLARFPQIAVMPIQKILKESRGDGGWINNLLRFVQDHVPVGRSWESIYPQVKALIDAPQGDEDEWETAECAQEWLDVLNRWRSSQEGLRCA